MILILGNGTTGQSVKRWCEKQGFESIFWAGDNDPTPIEILTQKDIKLVIQSPGISPHHKVITYLRSLNIPITNDIDLFMALINPEKCVGITGTNGKSTTTALTYHILNSFFTAHMGGNIGVPVLDLDCNKDDYYILELSSYQLEIAEKLSLFATVLLNITPDHLERHKTMDEYIKAKKKIFDRCQHPIICIDDTYTKTLAKELKCLTFSTKEEADFWVNTEDFLVMHHTPILDLKNLPLKGEHNFQNILAAFALTYTLGIPVENITKTIKSFKGLAHRLEIVAKKDHLLFVNDSKGTNAEATEKALLAYKNHEIHLILGGKAKTEGIDILKPYFKFIHKAYLIGNAAEAFAQTLEGKVSYTLCNTLENAVKASTQEALLSTNNPVVLLSPACASFDQFKSFEDRGNHFKAYVKAIVNMP